MFKIGDKVRTKMAMGDYDKGDELIIGDIIDFGDDNQFCRENDKAYGFFKKDLELVESTEYHVGDKVKIKNDIKIGPFYEGICFIKEMRDYPVVTIKHVSHDHYTVEENDFNYTKEMFEGLAEEPSYKKNIVALMDKQMNKGLSKYGELLEDNTTLSRNQRIEHLQEELIDGLQYCEHLKAVDDSITGNDYQRMALRTKAECNKRNQLLDGGLGIAGESGEVADIIKKNRFQGHTLDTEHLKEELGDVLWYIAIIADAIDTTLEEVMKINVDKLKERYPDGFDKNRSINREA